MKLIHCADLHLDSPLEANLSKEMARERARELRDTFLRLVRYAEAEGVSAILIAGDLFDSSSVRVSTYRFFLETVAAYPSISFFYLAGNHDKGVKETAEELPANLYCFSDEWRTYDLGEVTVTGSETPNEETLELDESRCNILLLHGQDRQGAGKREKDVIRMGLLRGKGIDYLALGHIHSYRVLPIDARGTAVYSGCLEGRGFDECGECGFVLLDATATRISHRFVPFARRRLYTVEVDVEGVSSHAALEARVMEAVADVEASALVKVVLTGVRSDARLLDTQTLVERLSEKLYFAKVKDESSVRIRSEDYERDTSLRGAFVRRVLASTLTEEERRRVIACGLRALSGEELGI